MSFLAFRNQEPGELGKKHLDHQSWEYLTLDRHFIKLKLSVLSCSIFVSLIALHKIHEHLNKNVNENMCLPTPTVDIPPFFKC